MDEFNLHSASLASPGIPAESVLQRRLEALKSRKEQVEEMSGLDALKNEEYRKVAQGFESMFVHMLMKQMKSSMLDKEDGQSDTSFFGDSVLSGYADLQFADYAARKGGLGIAEMVYSHLTGGAQLPLTTEQAVVSGKRTRRAAELQTPDANNKESMKARTFDHAASAATPLSSVRGNFLDNVIDRLRPYERIIAAASQQHKVPTSLIKGVIAAESAGKADALSPAGAKGLMQLMDGTAGDLGVSDSFDPEQNIRGGTRYLQQMLGRFDGKRELALAAYNAGPGNVEKYGGVPPFPETKAYIKNVARYADLFQILEQTSLVAGRSQNSI